MQLRLILLVLIVLHFRHGVLKGQLDTSAEFIRMFERVGWASNVRWPSRERIQARLAA